MSTGSTGYFDQFHKRGSGGVAQPSALDTARLVSDRSAYIAFLEAQLDKVSKRCLVVDAVDERLSTSEQAVQELNEKVVNATRLFQMSQRLFDQQVQDFARTQSASERGIGSAAQQLERHEEVLKREVERHRQFEHEVTEQLQRLAVRADTAERAFSDLAPRLAEIQTRMARIAEGHAQLDADYRQQTTTLRTRVAATEQGVTALRDDTVSRVERSLRAIAASVAQLEKQLTSESMSSAETAATMRTAVDELRRRADALDKRVGDGLSTVQQTVVRSDALRDQLERNDRARVQALAHMLAEHQSAVKQTIQAEVGGGVGRLGALTLGDMETRANAGSGAPSGTGSPHVRFRHDGGGSGADGFGGDNDDDDDDAARRGGDEIEREALRLSGRLDALTASVELRNQQMAEQQQQPPQLTHIVAGPGSPFTRRLRGTEYPHRPLEVPADPPAYRDSTTASHMHASAAAASLLASVGASATRKAVGKARKKLTGKSSAVARAAAAAASAVGRSSASRRGTAAAAAAAAGTADDVKRQQRRRRLTQIYRELTALQLKEMDAGAPARAGGAL